MGALPTGFIADAIGRRYTTLLMDVPFVIGKLHRYFIEDFLIIF